MYFLCPSILKAGANMEKQNWYSNKELFEMMEELKGDMTDLRLEMKETKTLIRDYNGLRKDVIETDKKISKLESKVKTHTSNRREYIGYIIAAISILFLILNYVR